MKFLAAGYFAVLLALSDASALASPEPRSVVDHFIAWYLDSGAGSFPGRKERAALRPLLTPSFGRVLEAAARGLECHYKATEGKEPPPLEGDLFVSLFEGATYSDGVKEIERTPERASYAIGWVSSPGRVGEKPVRWQDHVLLKRVKGRWLIDDFSHEGTWQFMTRGSVRSTLEEVAAECAKK
ncbi:MAG TPA: hypothetical protein VHL85_12485 [Burkholderiales bacterium]|jgi:hypothetical protein|nr:hypothetical protein [Burkholderiales bacterium]